MVHILMAAYNGEKYISEQIESILSQTYKDWVLFISDDCSRDNTYEIAKNYAEKYPNKIKVFKNNKNSGNSANNFFNMIKNSDADIIMTCDQDDIWLNDKVEITVKAFENVKEPMLVHTDLKLVDEKGRLLINSMIKYQHLKPLRNKTNQLIVQNVVTGCTMAINRPLADIIKIPKNQPVHDWYIAVIASLFGKIRYIDKATILYRQHSDNYCGSVNMESMEYISGRLKDSKKGKYMLQLGYDMASEILRLYNINNEMLKAYSNMEGYSKIKRLYVITKYKIWKCGIVRKLGQIYFM